MIINMKKIYLTVGIIFISIILFISLPYVVNIFIFTNENLCSIEIVKELYTEDDEYKIVAYILDCGATASASSNVSIIENDKDIKNETGNVFVSHYSGFIDIDLKNDQTIMIKHNDNDKDIFLKKLNMLDIEFEYALSSK